MLALRGAVATAAQPATNAGAGPAVVEAPDRQALAREILGLWENAPNPVNARNEAKYPDLRAALKAATTDQLLDAQRARTIDDLWTALPKGVSSPAAMPLAAGRVPHLTDYSPRKVGGATGITCTAICARIPGTVILY